MSSSTLRMTILYEDSEDGWVIASVPEVSGTHSQGRTRAEARTNVIDALATMLMPDDDLVGGDAEPLLLTIGR